MSFGSRFRSAREKSGYSQQELASILSVTDGTISNYENGGAYPRWNTINKICDILDVDPNYLFWDDMTEKIRNKIIETNLLQESSLKLLNDNYKCLNKKGRQKVIEYVEDLAQISNYSESLTRDSDVRLVANKKQSGDAVIRHKPKVT